MSAAKPFLRNGLGALVFSAIFSGNSANVPASEKLTNRLLSFRYEVDVQPIPSGMGPVDIFVPLAQSDSHQKIISRKVKATISGHEKTEKAYGNLFWHGHLKMSDGEPIHIQVDYLVDRRVFDAQKQMGPDKLSADEQAQLRKHLRANARVPVNTPIIDKIRKDLPPFQDNSDLAKARSIYDYVIDNMEYKKVGRGWGNGDTYWACSKKYGNCTDFHALFISLARAEGIPARFEIGFPIPEERKTGVIDGYHCWVTLYLPTKGWFPIDASEAKKYPERKELYFGTHPANLILFTRGRDLTLGTDHKSSPLNYFIYPHVEVGGKPYKKTTVHFSYSDEKETVESPHKKSQGNFELTKAENR